MDFKWPSALLFYVLCNDLHSILGMFSAELTNLLLRASPLFGCQK
jgi:hypothetical protein